MEVAGKGAGGEHAGCHESSVEGREDREDARCSEVHTQGDPANARGDCVACGHAKEINK